MSDTINKTAVDLSNLKSGGFIKERGKDLFTVRLRVPGGRMTVPRLKKIAAVAEKFGGEFVHLSVRGRVGAHPARRGDGGGALRRHG